MKLSEYFIRLATGSLDDKQRSIELSLSRLQNISKQLVEKSKKDKSEDDLICGSIVTLIDGELEELLTKIDGDVRDFNFDVWERTSKTREVATSSPENAANKIAKGFEIDL